MSAEITQGMQTTSISRAGGSPYDVKLSLRQLGRLYSDFKLLSCRTCKSPLRLGEIHQHARTWLNVVKSNPTRQVSAIYCEKCRSLTCIGCHGKPVLGKGNMSTPIAVINHCCEQGRLFGIWIFLCIFDDNELLQQNRALGNAKKNENRARTDSGVGYSGDSLSLYNMATQPKSLSQDDNQRVFSTTTTLELLTAFLPLVTSNIDFQWQLPKELFLFRLSFLFDQVSTLMRNDSIADIAENPHLYHGAFKFVQAVASHPGLVILLFEQRLDKTDWPGLQSLSEASQPSMVHDKSLGETSASLFVCSKDTDRQAKMFLEFSAKAEGSKVLVKDEESILLCKGVVHLFETMEKVAPASISESPLVAGKDPWTKYNEENRVTFTDEVLQGHIFLKSFSTLKASNHGRMTALWREIANMTTSLPSGIFLKVAESPSDVMKALIIGADGSPYAGGLFMYVQTLPSKHFLRCFLFSFLNLLHLLQIR